MKPYRTTQLCTFIYRTALGYSPAAPILLGSAEAQKVGADEYTDGSRYGLPITNNKQASLTEMVRRNYEPQEWTLSGFIDATYTIIGSQPTPGTYQEDDTTFEPQVATVRLTFNAQETAPAFVMPDYSRFERYIARATASTQQPIEGIHPLAHGDAGEIIGAWLVVQGSVTVELRPYAWDTGSSLLLEQVVGVSFTAGLYRNSIAQASQVVIPDEGVSWSGDSGASSIKSNSTATYHDNGALSVTDPLMSGGSQDWGSIPLFRQDDQPAFVTDLALRCVVHHLPHPGL